MDSFDFNEQEKKQSSDIYFSNETSIQSLEKTADKVIAKQKKSGGVGSTYLFFIIVIIVSVVVSIYAILCMNDIFAITKTKSNVTVSY